MKKIAFISDIHSNLPALEATLEDIKSRGVEDIYCLGDLVGYHCFPNEVIELLKKEGVISIKGNHDDAIVMENFDREREADFPLYWNSDNLTEVNREYLSELPLNMTIEAEGVSIKIVHGSPASLIEYIREGSPEADQYITEMDTDILICGHTHIPYIVKKNGKTLLNSGSVGKPKFGKPEASYTLLTVDKGSYKPETISLPYDVESITGELRRLNFPQKLVTALETGLP